MGRQGPHRARGHHQVHPKQYRHSTAVTDLIEFPDRAEIAAHVAGFLADGAGGR
jgi:hypothetical protein